MTKVIFASALVLVAHGPTWCQAATQEVVYAFTMDQDPGWFRGGAYNDWQWHAPMGPAYNDPILAHTGLYVYGNDLTGLGSSLGRYENSLPANQNYLRTSALDFRGWTNVHVRFWRWLSIEDSSWDHATVEVSTNLANWTTIFSSLSDIHDSSWIQVEYSMAAQASDRPDVYVRWNLGPTDGSQTYGGWNIDDVEFWAEPLLAPHDTPIPWLIRHGLTNGTWTTEEDADTDTDGVLNKDEYVADTDPTNAASYFSIKAFSNPPPFKVYFLSSSNRNYTLQACADLIAKDWTNVVTQTDIQGTGGLDSFQDAGSAPRRFYRIRVKASP